jgi:hypothetical protein
MVLMKGQEMELEEIEKDIKEQCDTCNECEPWCTGNLLLKCIENERSKN